jgi:single-strand DNA-binding protein
MNKVILQGRVTKDPDLRYTPNGVPVATFTMAVNRKFKNEQGERQADFINCVIWRKPAETAANYLKKGFRVLVVGSWQTRNYEGQDGKKVYVNECVIDEFDLIDFDNQNGQNSNGNHQGNTNTSGNQYNSNPGQNNRFDNDPFSGPGQIDISDDDLPF